MLHKAELTQAHTNSLLRTRYPASAL